MPLIVIVPNAIDENPVLMLPGRKFQGCFPFSARGPAQAYRLLGPTRKLSGRHKDSPQRRSTCFTAILSQDARNNSLRSRLCTRQRDLG